MPFESDPEMGINSWFEEEQRQRYLLDPTAVDESWRRVFEGEVGQALPPASPPGDLIQPRSEPRTSESGRPSIPRTSESGRPSPPAPLPGDQLQPLRGAAGRIAENMSASLAIPLATSQRTIAVKLMDENRRIVNQHRTLLGRGKVSYTHFIGWATRQDRE
jgi:pyruvate/2-oxoglutarate dehydrogenase complex dihydrolipoamide acyltransferase (E2) component